MWCDSDYRDHAILALSTDWLGEFIVATRLMPNEQVAQDIKSVARSIVSQMFGRAASYFEIDLSDERRERSYDSFMQGVAAAMRKQDAEYFSRLIALLQGNGRLSKNVCWAIKNFFVDQDEVVLAGIDPLFARRGKELVDQVDAILEKSLSRTSKWDEDLSRMFSGNMDFIPDFAKAVILPGLFLDRLAESVASLGLSLENRAHLARSIASGANWLGVEVAAEAIECALSSP